MIDVPPTNLEGTALRQNPYRGYLVWLRSLLYAELGVLAALRVVGFSYVPAGVHFFLASHLASNFAYVLTNLHSSHQVSYIVFSLFSVH